MLPPALSPSPVCYVRSCNPDEVLAYWGGFFLLRSNIIAPVGGNNKLFIIEKHLTELVICDILLLC